MITAIDTSRTVTYVSRYDATEPKTKWKIGILKADESNYIRERVLSGVAPKDSLSKVDGKTLIELSRLYLLFGLKGWSDLYKADGSTLIIFETEEVKIGPLGMRTVVKQELLQEIHPAILDELVEQIGDANTLTEADAKN